MDFQGKSVPAIRIRGTNKSKARQASADIGREDTKPPAREVVDDELASTPHSPRDRRSVDFAKRDQVGGRKAVACRDGKTICIGGAIDIVQLEHADSQGAVAVRGDSNARNAHATLAARKGRAKLRPRRNCLPGRASGGSVAVKRASRGRNRIPPIEAIPDQSAQLGGGLTAPVHVQLE